MTMSKPKLGRAPADSSRTIPVLGNTSGNSFSHAKVAFLPLVRDTRLLPTLMLSARSGSFS